MAIRADIKDFPFSNRTRTTWYFLVNWEKKEIEDFTGVSGKEPLVGVLADILSKNQEENYALYGSWHGEYGTDIFKIPLKTGFDELSKHFVKKKS